MASATELRERARSALRGKFQRDALWNFGSVAVLGVCGFGLNLLIGRYYGAAALGVFNQVMAALHLLRPSRRSEASTCRQLRAISEHRADRQRVTAIIVGAIVPAVSLALASSAVFWFSRHWIADLLDSPGVAEGMAVATPGLFFFALNKIGMSIVNAAQRMRAFALYTSLRYSSMLLGLYVAHLWGLADSRLAFLFSFAEGILFVPLAIEVARQMSGRVSATWREWSREHLRYGVRSVVSGMLLELNSRIDVLMLGYFLSDAPVGVYSVAALVAEGVFQLLIVLQNNYNPILARGIAAGELAELERVVARGKRFTYALMAGVGAVAVAGFPLFLRIIGKSEFQGAWAPFAWLMLGMFLASGYMPFAQTLLMANHPARHSLMMSAIVLCNSIGCVLLIPGARAFGRVHSHGDFARVLGFRAALVRAPLRGTEVVRRA
jgi:O-antigen/teichoic acid export membrane protein